MQWHTLANAQSLLLGSASWSGWGYLGCLMFSILDEAAASLSDPPPLQHDVGCAAGAAPHHGALLQHNALRARVQHKQQGAAALRLGGCRDCAPAASAVAMAAAWPVYVGSCQVQQALESRRDSS